MLLLDSATLWRIARFYITRSVSFEVAPWSAGGTVGYRLSSLRDYENATLQQASARDAHLNPSLAHASG